MTGPNDKWPILADPNPDDEEWPLQPNIDPAPAPTEPAELRYQPHLPLPEPSTLFDKVRRIAFIMMISQLVPLVLTLFARIASADEPGLTTVQIIGAVGCALCFFVPTSTNSFSKGIAKESIVTCPRKYCLIDTCTNDLDSYHPDALPNPDADPEQYQTYQPHEPPTVASQVDCIAGNTFMYLAVFTVISLALQLTPISDSIVEIIMIILGVATGISLVIAAVAEQFVDRHKATDTEPPPW